MSGFFIEAPLTCYRLKKPIIRSTRCSDCRKKMVILLYLILTTSMITSKTKKKQISSYNTTDDRLDNSATHNLLYHTGLSYRQRILKN